VFKYSLFIITFLKETSLLHFIIIHSLLNISINPRTKEALTVQTTLFYLISLQLYSLVGFKQLLGLGTFLLPYVDNTSII